MEQGQNPTPSGHEMIDAFVHPPILIPIGKRIEADRVVVLSHIELWPWRTVVRGVIAQRDVRPPVLPAATADDDPSITGGVVTAHVVDSSDDMWADRREGIEWMSDWTLIDDIGTNYESRGWHGLPTTGQLWSDVAWEYRTPTPADARVLTLAHPDFAPIAIRRRTSPDHSAASRFAT